MRISRFWWVAIAALALICVTGYVWHWSAGIRVSWHNIRLETQRGEIAVSLWIGSPDYKMEAPMFFAHAADARTRLMDASPRRKLGLGWMPWNGEGGAAPGTIGLVLRWWHCLLGVLLLSQWKAILLLLARPFRRREARPA